MEVLVTKLFKCYSIATSCLLVSYVVCHPQFGSYSPYLSNGQRQSRVPSIDTNYSLPISNAATKSVKFPSSISFQLTPNLEERMDAHGNDKLIRSPFGSEWAVEAQSSPTHITRGTRSNKTSSSIPDPIIFPDQIDPSGKIKVLNSRGKPPNSFDPTSQELSPLCAENTTFCENTDNYPELQIENLLKSKEPQLRHLFGIDLLPNDLHNRIDDNREIELCASSVKVIFPKIGQNKDDQWVFIVNNEKYKQGVLIEECKNIEGSCQFSETFPIGYKTTCKQKYIYRKLVAIDKTTGNPGPDSFKIPSCCSCVVLQTNRYNSNILMRSGGGKPDTETISALPLLDQAKKNQATNRSDPRSLENLTHKKPEN